MGESTLMQLQETDRIRKFDIDSFVSYQTDEDVTPTAEELIEEIPQHLMPVGPSEEEIAAKAAKPRRGKAYLRTEIDEQAEATSNTETNEPEADDFGAGIVNDLPETTDRRQQPDSTDSGEPDQSTESTTDHPGRKRKRRRKRRSRGAGRREGDAGGEAKPANDSSTPSSDTAPTLTAETQTPSSDSTADPSTASTAAPSTTAGKKRRRRRRRRGKGPAASSAGTENNSGNTPPSSAAD